MRPASPSADLAVWRAHVWALLAGLFPDPEAAPSASQGTATLSMRFNSCPTARRDVGWLLTFCQFRTPRTWALLDQMLDRTRCKKTETAKTPNSSTYSPPPDPSFLQHANLAPLKFVLGVNLPSWSHF